MSILSKLYSCNDEKQSDCHHGDAVGPFDVYDLIPGILPEYRTHRRDTFSEQLSSIYSSPSNNTAEFILWGDL
jgi:hypothetical protein